MNSGNRAILRGRVYGMPLLKVHRWDVAKTAMAPDGRQYRSLPVLRFANNALIANIGSLYFNFCDGAWHADAAGVVRKHYGVLGEDSS